ncbi:MAG: 2-oxoacid:ferredoxin oxidoreductase subunit beta [Actinomycetota bacterium]|nr:2-oxoacid:ferredoxin oxidoreductase subunit beta [Actinomycetota bacterium]
MPKLGLDIDQYLRTEVLPTVWCPGCGNGNIVEGIGTAFSRIGLDTEKVVVVGGIGCSGRTPFYVRTNAMHTTHGRALAYATGLKMANPELTVVVTMGDGDALAIGGNHFIHAARRNLDLTAIVYNNGIYGMTGGQEAPTTPVGSRTTTSLHGAVERTFDTIELALAAGASYVARTTTFDMQEIPLRIEEALRHKGFSVVEVLTQCPTYYGRLNRIGDPSDMLIWEREHTSDEPVTLLSREELVGPLRTGVFRNQDDPEYTEVYREMCASQGGSYAAG